MQRRVAQRVSARSSALFRPVQPRTLGCCYAGNVFRREQGLQTTATPDVLSLLSQRGLIKDIAGDRDVLRATLQKRQVGFYAGIDPTAPSLHLGHLLPLMVLFWLYVHGHHTISLIGGATAQVGDPSGRLVSRTQTKQSVHLSNTEALHKQIDQIWEKAEAYGQRHGYVRTTTWRRSLLDNTEWLLKLNVVDFLRVLGSGMRIGAMLGRDTVKNKMEKGDGMSFAEFTYPLLQGWDWWHMFQHHAVQVQIGGSDQYGNIIAGMETIKHCAQQLDESIQTTNITPMGLTTPLLTTSRGEKFGKSAGNAVWLDPALTSPFDLYGFLLRTADDDIERYLKLFTFVPLDVIQDIMGEHARAPGKRQAQHLLASEVCELVHGHQQAKDTARSHQSMRQPVISSLLDPAADSTSSQHAQRITLPKSLVTGVTFARLLHCAGLVATKAEGTRMIKNGGLYVAVPAADQASKGSGTPSFVQITDQKPEEFVSLTQTDVLVLRLGKWKVRLVEAINDDAFADKGLTVPGQPDWTAP